LPLASNVKADNTEFDCQRRQTPLEKSQILAMVLTPRMSSDRVLISLGATRIGGKVICHLEGTAWREHSIQIIQCHRYEHGPCCPLRNVRKHIGHNDRSDYEVILLESKGTWPEECAQYSHHLCKQYQIYMMSRKHMFSGFSQGRKHMKQP
jgi:hypothetical protein